MGAGFYQGGPGGGRGGSGVNSSFIAFLMDNFSCMIYSLKKVIQVKKAKNVRCRCGIEGNLC
jgi:hypothetical protein